MSIYTDNGYLNRTDYLEQLAEDLGADREEVRLVADMLGPNEDFDGLVSVMEDRVDYYL